MTIQELNRFFELLEKIQESSKTLLNNKYKVSMQEPGLETLVQTYELQVALERLEDSIK